MKREIIYLSLHCHHQNDSCIKMGSDESHLNVSVGSDGQSRKTVSTNHNLMNTVLLNLLCVWTFKLGSYFNFLLLLTDPECRPNHHRRQVILALYTINFTHSSHAGRIKLKRFDFSVAPVLDIAPLTSVLFASLLCLLVTQKHTTVESARRVRVV